MQKTAIDITKPKHQWKEGLIFVTILAIVGGSYLTFNNWKTNQAQAAISQGPVCSWDNTRASTIPELAQSNLFTNSSLEEIDTNQTHPLNWQPSSWGENHSKFDYIQTTAHTGQRSLEVQYAQPQDGDSKWVTKQVIAVTPNSTYLFKDWYQSNVKTEIIAEFTMEDGAKQYQTLQQVPETVQWKEFVISFVSPDKAQFVNIFHAIKRPGYLLTDDYFLAEYQPQELSQAMISLTFDDGSKSIHQYGLPILEKYGFKSTQYLVTQPIMQPNSYYYINRGEVQDFINKGHEIGSHTLSHKNLVELNSALQLQELAKSQQDLYSLLGSTTPNFAVPYGAYNDQVIDLAKKYYCSHRSTDSGYNSPDLFDLYNIKVKNIEADVSLQQVQQWLNYAQEHKIWLVLVFHDITNDGGQFSYTTQDLDNVLAEIGKHDIKTTTMSEAILIMQQRQSELNLVK